MKITKEQLNLKEGTTKEWIVTNGIGGYSSSTIIGMNTRKYHGLLVAPLTPPARRFLILSKIDESIKINNNTYNLYSNMCKDYISDGYKYQEEFEKDYIPIFKYKVENITITKMICMDYGKNTVCVLYQLQNNGEKAILNLAPIINFRDFHTMTTNYNFKLKQEIKNKKVKIEVNENSNNPIYINISDGIYKEHFNDIFKDMYYQEEEKRGFFPEENLSVPGVFEVEIPADAKKEVSIVCSLDENIEEINVKKVINKEIIRINEIVYQTNFLDKKQDIEKETKEEKEFRKWLIDFCIATDNFVVYRPKFGLHTIIAGYPWFLDWGRDSLISFEGLLLITKRFRIAREVLLTYVKDVKFGLIPNGYSGYDNRPLYNSADSSLLLFEQIYKYLKYTADYKYIKENIYDTLVIIIESYKKGIDFDDNNIFLDEDFLISSGTEKTQNTWMDAKYGETSFTPRNGKTVELNSLWYNALVILTKLSIKFGKRNEAKEYAELAEKCKKSFENKFYNPKKQCLFDVIGDDKIRPNQLFALSLSNPIIEPNSEIGQNTFETVTKTLLNKYGLKTLASKERGYVGTYEGNAFKRDSSYHQGITWPWLLGLYYDSLKNMILTQKDREKKKEQEEQLKEFITNVEKTFKKAMQNDGAIGSISEIYDSKPPQLPKGCIAQAWSIAEVFRIIIKK